MSHGLITQNQATVINTTVKSTTDRCWRRFVYCDYFNLMNLLAVRISISTNCVKTVHRLYVVGAVFSDNSHVTSNERHKSTNQFREQQAAQYGSGMNNKTDFDEIS
jgi:hypothetical protein